MHVSRAAMSIVVFLVGIGILIARVAVPPSELATKGNKALGQVLFKDSQPGENNQFTYTVTFVFPDASQRNHQVTRVVPNKALWDRLTTNQDVKVLYMPSNPEEASIAGAEGLARPHDAAYGFLGWSLILLGLVLLGLHFRNREAAMARDGAGTAPSVRQ